MVDDEGSESLEGMMVTRDYFRVVGLQPALGRAFDEAEIGVSPPPTIILGYELWQRKFNGDPHIVGKTIRMSRRDTPPTIIGVMPRASDSFHRRERRRSPTTTSTASSISGCRPHPIRRI